LKQTLEEWDAVGRAPGHICGLIEGSEVGLHEGRQRKPEALKRKRRGERG